MASSTATEFGKAITATRTLANGSATKHMAMESTSGPTETGMKENGLTAFVTARVAISLQTATLL